MTKILAIEQNLSVKDRKIYQALLSSHHDVVARHEALSNIEDKWRDRGTKRSILRRLCDLGWGGIKEGMAGCQWTPEEREWSHYLGAPPEGIPWGPEGKLCQMPDGSLKNITEGLCGVIHCYEQNRSIFRFFEIIKGNAANCEPYARWVFTIWRRDSILKQCVEESKAAGLHRETDLEKLRVDFEQRDGPRIAELPGSLDNRLEEFRILDADIRAIFGDDCPIPPINFARDPVHYP